MTDIDALRGRTLLVVEDEYLVADELCRELAAHGAGVLGPAPSVAAALALLDRGAHVDAAILDVNVGGRPAFPVADALAARGVPFVFVTGYDRWALPAAYAHVPRCEKPLHLPDVAEALFG